MMTTKALTHRCRKCRAAMHEDDIRRVTIREACRFPENRREPEDAWFCPECGARGNIERMSDAEAGELAERAAELAEAEHDIRGQGNE